MTELDIISTVKPFTMTSGKNILATVHAINVVDQGIPGDIVECGVWRGGHIIAAMLAASVSRTYWLYDTFDGMVEPGPWDYRRGIHATETTAYKKRGIKNWCNASLFEVQHNIARFQNPTQTIHYIVGDVVETLTTEPAPTQIAVLRLDTDFYESTKAELQHLWPKVVSGGVLIVDDYFSWDGCRRACDEFFTSDTKFEHIDGPAVRYIKP